MKNWIKKRLLALHFKMKPAGFDSIAFITHMRGFPYYRRTRSQLIKQRGADTSFVLGRRYPILNERKEESGTMTGHYFHQDLFVARKIFERNPQRHIDIGSRTDGFVAHVAVFREIEIIDIRAQSSSVKNIRFTQADLMQLPEELIASSDSVSSLHAVEHFGLGRYGDPIDYYGYRKAIENMARMVIPGGIFYFSVPIGPQRIEFNAQRVFSVDYLLKMLQKDFTVQAFSLVDDSGNFFENVGLDPGQIATNYGCFYGCGIFECIKQDNRV